MWVFYYQWQETGRTYVVCVRGSFPTIHSPIWNNVNTCAWMVPGTFSEDNDEKENEQ